MPYIKKEDRAALSLRSPETPGELNYLITALLHKYAAKHGHCYTTYNELVSAVEQAKSELYLEMVKRSEFLDLAARSDLVQCLDAIWGDYVHALNYSYSAYSSALGALECAKLEFQRRHIAPYEDTKIAENGDVP